MKASLSSPISKSPHRDKSPVRNYLIEVACATIAHAVVQATPGDTLALAAGAYAEPDLVIDKALNIQGAGVIVQ